MSDGHQEHEESPYGLATVQAMLEAHRRGYDLDPGPCDSQEQREQIALHNECCRREHHHHGGGEWSEVVAKRGWTHLQCARGVEHCTINHELRGLEAIGEGTAAWGGVEVGRLDQERRIACHR